MHQIAVTSCLQAHSPELAPAQSEESVVPANSLDVSQSPSERWSHLLTRSHHSNLTFPSQGSALCILAQNNSQFRLTQQNLSLLQEIEAGKLSWRRRRETEQVIPGHCRDKRAPTRLQKCPAVLPDCECKGKGPREKSVSSLLLFTHPSYNKQSLLPFNSSVKINLCSEKLYNNKQAAQLQSSQATQNEYIFKQRLHRQ